MENKFNKFPNKKREHPQLERGIIFKKETKKIIDAGYLAHSLEHDENGKEPKTYHTSEHPRTLTKRAERMAEILHLSSEQLAIIKMAIAWHDTVINYDKADPKNIVGMIRRHRGAREGDILPGGVEYGINGNEGQSAKSLENKMREANKLAGQEIFIEEQIHTAVWAIEATYPDVNSGLNFNGAIFEEYPYYQNAIDQNLDFYFLLNELKEDGINKGHLFFQTHLEKALEESKEVPLEVLIIALSDLAAAGVAGKKEFFKEGDNEMRELYGNLRNPEIMQGLINGETETDKVGREKVSAAFIKWLDSQPGFAIWQALRFEKIIYLLKKQNRITLEEGLGLRSQFSHFIDNVRASYDRAKELKQKFEEMKTMSGEKESFKFLAKELHYEI